MNWINKDLFPKEEELLWIDSKFACGGVVIKNNMVIDSAPIFRKWFKGKSKNQCINIIKSKKWKYKEI